MDSILAPLHHLKICSCQSSFSNQVHSLPIGGELEIGFYDVLFIKETERYQIG